MAAVLKHGYEPARPAAMYSLFNTDDHETFQNRPENNPSCDLDGTNDLRPDNPFTRAKIGSRNTTEHSTVQYDTSTKQASLHLPDHQSVNIASSIDIDPASSRRKRRKITPTNRAQNMSVEQKETSGADESTGTVDHAQHTISTGGDALMSSTQVSTINHSQEEASMNSLDKAPRTPRKRAPRKTQAKTGTETGGDTSHQSISNSTADPRPPKIKGLTPKKKNIALHTNGKLLSSPATDSLPLKGTNVKDDKKLSSRNFKMKNGKFVQSFEVVLRYGQDENSRETIGRKIDALLVKSKGTMLHNDGQDLSKTHPFFLGKVKPKTQVGEQALEQGDKTDNDTDSTSRQHEPVAWKDIKFNTQKPGFYKSVELARPVWPPLSIHHVGRQPSADCWYKAIENSSAKAKAKSRLVHLNEDEDILRRYVKQLKTRGTLDRIDVVPEKHYLSGRQVAQRLDAVCLTSHSYHDAILSARSRLISGSSAFDRGECAGPNAWISHFAPACVSEVLQPLAPILHKWLQSLAIHNVKSGIDINGSLKKPKNQTKKKRRKLKTDFDDFIVDTDDELDEGKLTKTAILIAGPHGCGKTASVYAVAKELGFEVFEIHPGMRRSAKDIFDKVGDMAHNHLVQKGSELSRSSSVAPSDNDTVLDVVKDRKQMSITGSLGAASTVTAKLNDQQALPKVKKEQKQSLILFEEADLLFDDDKGFWNGVQSLIMNSKRPIVLTCNDLTSIPLEDLNLYDVLTYDSVEQETATDYLTYLAAAEGHILDRKALSSLYMSKNKDLRASITELNLWCQMTVGSKCGGLDWMDRSLPSQSRTNDNGERLRIFSEGTYHESLDLAPHIHVEGEDAIRFHQDTLGIDASDWCDSADALGPGYEDSGYTESQILSRISDIIEARSVIDLLDEFAAPVLSDVTTQLSRTEFLASDRRTIASLYVKNITKDVSHKQQLIEAFGPIMTEKPTFPPSQGRLAPSIDAATSSIATEVAPYVRCIVNFDRRLEEQRDEFAGSQGKTRKTRAARAAAEGGDKASTRSERWFPKDLDFDKVTRTSGVWPEWYEQLQYGSSGADPVSPAKSSEI